MTRFAFVTCRAPPSWYVTLSMTEYVPGFAYAWLGLLVVEVWPSPKVHNHAVGLPGEVSVNWTARGLRPVTGVAVKVAAGVFMVTQPSLRSLVCGSSRFSIQT